LHHINQVAAYLAGMFQLCNYFLTPSTSVQKVTTGSKRIYELILHRVRDIGECCLQNKVSILVCYKSHDVSRCTYFVYILRFNSQRGYTYILHHHIIYRHMQLTYSKTSLHDYRRAFLLRQLYKAANTLTAHNLTQCRTMLKQRLNNIVSISILERWLLRHVECNGQVPAS